MKAKAGGLAVRHRRSRTGRGQGGPGVGEAPDSRWGAAKLGSDSRHYPSADGGPGESAVLDRFGGELGAGASEHFLEGRSLGKGFAPS